MFKNKSLEANSGEKFDYSDNNYILLTYIIEKTSDQQYKTFLKEHIFDRLGMKDTGVDDFQNIIKNIASSYSTKNDELVNADYLDMSFEAGAGALYSTVQDLYRWDRALYTDKLVSEISLNKIFTPHKDNYGYGWLIKTSSRGKVLSHDGHNPGARTIINRYVDHNVCIIVLSNFDFAPVPQIAQNLEHIVFGQKPEYPTKRVAIVVNPVIYDQYTGTYTAKNENMNFVVTKEHDKLFAELVEEQDKCELYPTTKDKFLLKSVDAQISFIKDQTGR